eukprot:Nitzschia sp. Nitz4//scaffold124_size66437//25636//38731//NITZ4_006111-RA/size66437-processed-gene-0.6-mRNA-1//1//CDS//3329534552//6004//frame0
MKRETLSDWVEAVRETVHGPRGPRRSDLLYITDRLLVSSQPAHAWPEPSFLDTGRDPRAPWPKPRDDDDETVDDSDDIADDAEHDETEEGEQVIPDKKSDTAADETDKQETTEVPQEAVIENLPLDPLPETVSNVENPQEGDASLDGETSKEQPEPQPLQNDEGEEAGNHEVEPPTNQQDTEMDPTHSPADKDVPTETEPATPADLDGDTSTPMDDDENDAVEKSATPQHPPPSALFNSPATLVNFLNQRHGPDHFLLFSLTDERPDDRTLLLFRRQVVQLGWWSPCMERSHIPSIAKIMRACYAIHAYLSLHPKNVAHVYCANGKTRTAIVVACYLRFSGLVPTSQDGFLHFLAKRGVHNPQDTWDQLPPSLQSFFSQFDKSLELGGFLNRKPLMLRAIALQGIPVEDKPCLDIWDSSQRHVYSSHPEMWASSSSSSSSDGSDETQCRSNLPAKMSQWADEEGFYKINVLVEGDFLLLCRFGGNFAEDSTAHDPSKVLFRYTNTTGFLTGAYPYELPPNKIDLSRQYASFFDDDDFLVTLLFEASWEQVEGLSHYQGELLRRSSRGTSDRFYRSYETEACEEGCRVILEHHSARPDKDDVEFFRHLYQGSELDNCQDHLIFIALQLSNFDFTKTKSVLDSSAFSWWKSPPAIERGVPGIMSPLSSAGNATKEIIGLLDDVNLDTNIENPDLAQMHAIMSAASSADNFPDSARADLNPFVRNSGWMATSLSFPMQGDIIKSFPEHYQQFHSSTIQSLRISEFGGKTRPRVPFFTRDRTAWLPASTSGSSTLQTLPFPTRDPKKELAAQVQGTLRHTGISQSGLVELMEKSQFWTNEPIEVEDSESDEEPEATEEQARIPFLRDSTMMREAKEQKEREWTDAQKAEAREKEKQRAENAKKKELDGKEEAAPGEETKPAEEGDPPLKDDPEYAKYFKMLKMGMPKEQVMHAMTRDSKDVTILDLDPNMSLNAQRPKDEPADGEVPLKSDPEYEKYFKMLKMGLPMGAVKNALVRDGKDPSIMDLDPNKSVKSQLAPKGGDNDDGPPLKEDPEYEKYFKMLKMGLPVGAVKNALTRDGKDPGIMDLDPEKSLKSQTGGGGGDDGPPLKDDPEYEKYFKMLKMGLPVGAVKNALSRDGKDPGIMDLDPNKSLKSQTGGGAAEDTGPPLKDDPEYAKYFKMLAMGLPLGAVKNALSRDGKDPSIMELDPNLSVKAQLGGGEEKDTGVPLKEDPEYSKYFKMLAMGLPAGAVKNALERDGKDPAILDMDPTKSVAFQLKKKGAGNKKPVKKKKRVRRKKIYWNPIDPSKLKEDSMWNIVRGAIAMDKLKYDQKEFEDLFTESAEPGDKNKNKSEEKKEVKKLVQVIDPKRSMNGGIVLSRLKMPHAQTAEVVNKMEHGKFDSTQLKALKEYLPDDDERIGLKAYLKPGEKSEEVHAKLYADCSETEKYMVTMMDVPDPQRKIDAMLFRTLFKTRLEESTDAIRTLNNACDELRSSQRLRKLMAVILTVVNQINTGGEGKMAMGFTLDALLKLNEAKAFDKKTSVLHYVVKLVKKNDVSLSMFDDDLPSVIPAQSVLLDGLSADVKSISDELVEVDKTVVEEAERLEQNGELQPMSVTENSEHKSVTSAEESAQDSKGGKPPGRTAMERFAIDAKSACDQALDSIDNVKKKYAALLQYFGEDEQMATGDFFGTLTRFIAEWRKAVEQVETIERKEAKEKKRAAAKAAKAKRKTQPKSSAAPTSGASKDVKPKGVDSTPSVATSATQPSETSGETPAAGSNVTNAVPSGLTPPRDLPATTSNKAPSGGEGVTDTTEVTENMNAKTPEPDEKASFAAKAAAYRRRKEKKDDTADDGKSKFLSSAAAYRRRKSQRDLKAYGDEAAENEISPNNSGDPEVDLRGNTATDTTDNIQQMTSNDQESPSKHQADPTDKPASNDSSVAVSSDVPVVTPVEKPSEDDGNVPNQPVEAQTETAPKMDPTPAADSVPAASEKEASNPVTEQQASDAKPPESSPPLVDSPASPTRENQVPVVPTPVASSNEEKTVPVVTGKEPQANEVSPTSNIDAHKTSGRILFEGPASGTTLDFYFDEYKVDHSNVPMSPEMDESSVAIMANNLQKRALDSHMSESWTKGDTIQNFMGWADQAIRASDSESVRNFETSMDLNDGYDFDDESTIATYQDDVSVMSWNTQSQNSATGSQFRGIENMPDMEQPMIDSTSNSVVTPAKVAASILFNDSPVSSVELAGPGAVGRTTQLPELDNVDPRLSYQPNNFGLDAGLAYAMEDAGLDDGLGFGSNGLSFGGQEEFEPTPGDAWVGDTATQVALQREQRQRSLRFLMMFLLMLTLMDGEEATRRENQRHMLRGRKPKQENPEVALFFARRQQDEQLEPLLSNHPRYQRLIQRNEKKDVEQDIRNWTDHAHNLTKDEMVLGFWDEATVFHYPWNVTGGYHGTWVSTTTVSTTNATSGEPMSVIPSQSASSNALRIKTTKNGTTNVKPTLTSPLEAESAVLGALTGRHENFGLVLLPNHSEFHLPNSSIPKDPWGELHPNSRPPPGSLRGVARDYSPTNLARFDTISSLPNGTVALSLQVRPVPHMKEMSVVDGLMRLCSAKDTFCSTGKGALVRLRGVAIHSIGTIKLVSSSSLGRGAFAINGNTTTPTPETVVTTQTNTSESNRTIAWVPKPNASDHVFPYPFVEDDIDRTVATAMERLDREYSLNDQAKLGDCEFEVQFNIQEEEWTIGKWRNLLYRRAKEIRKSRKRILSGEKADDAKAKKSTSDSSKRKRPPDEAALAMILNGTIVSHNCNFSATIDTAAVRVDWKVTTGKATMYSAVMMVACLAQIVILLRQLLHSRSQSAATRMSLLCIGWQTVLDAILCFIHVLFSLTMPPLFAPCACIAFFKFLIFCVIEMKYMTIIVQSRHSNTPGNTAESLRRKIATLHLRFYFGLVGAIMLGVYLWEWGLEILYMMLLYSFWVPQIVSNVITLAKHPLHRHYLYGMSISRLVAPLYAFGVSGNFLKEAFPYNQTNIPMCQLIVGWVFVQTAILEIQSRYGARSIIPARFLPPKFDYSRPIPASLLPSQDEETGNSPTEDLRNERGGTTEARGAVVSRDSKILRPTGARNRMKGTRGTRSEGTMTSETVPTTVARPTPTFDCVICYNGIDIRDRKGTCGVLFFTTSQVEGFPSGFDLINHAIRMGAVGGVLGLGNSDIIVRLTNPLNTPMSNQAPILGGATVQTDDPADRMNPSSFQFPWKLHDMLDNAATEGVEDIVSWQDGGRSFRVHKPQEFVDRVMCRYFKQTKYKSFQRQLNLYGFSRLSEGSSKGGYRHQYFVRGQRTLCQLITRSSMSDAAPRAELRSPPTAEASAVGGGGGGSLTTASPSPTGPKISPSTTAGASSSLLPSTPANAANPRIVSDAASRSSPEADYSNTQGKEAKSLRISADPYKVLLHKEYQFPWKLQEVLERAELDGFEHVVSWIPGSNCFKVHDPPTFVDQVLPRFFKQTKYKSFQRQLNLYGFTRVDDGPNKGSYRHPFFVKGNQELLNKMTRQKIKGSGPVITQKDDKEATELESSVPRQPPSSFQTGNGIPAILAAIERAEAVDHSEGSSQAEGSEHVPLGDGLSWRDNPSESFSDWTIEVIHKGTATKDTYNVHRRVLAVGPKRSDFFARLFKQSGTSNTSSLDLEAVEADVFPLILDHMYSEQKLQLDFGRGYVLYRLAEKLEIQSVVQAVTEFYCKSMNKENIVDFFTIAETFKDKTFLEATVAFCSAELRTMHTETAGKIKPSILLEVLRHNRNLPKKELCSSRHLSLLMATSVDKHAENTSPEIFREITQDEYLQEIEPEAAIRFLAAENVIMAKANIQGDTAFEDRCVRSLCASWTDIKNKLLERGSNLPGRMQAISSKIMYQILMNTTS